MAIPPQTTPSNTKESPHHLGAHTHHNIHTTNTNYSTNKTVYRVRPRTHKGNTTDCTMEPPGAGPHSGQGSTCLVVQPCLAYRCAGWSHLARTRRCGQAKLWTVTSIDLSHPRLSVIPALAATLHIGQLAVRNRGKPLHTISSTAMSGVAHIPKGAWNA